jgi:hypothetical protein
MPYPVLMPDTVADMMSDFAAAAVETARSMNVTLDYSEESLQAVEGILAQLHDELRGGTAAVRSLDHPPATPSSADMAEVSKLWGSYFGEVVRRRWGGDWSIETYPGAGFATLTLTVNGGKMFPSMKIYRRLTEGEQDNIWSFYQQVRKKLAAAPRGAVQ